MNGGWAAFAVLLFGAACASGGYVVGKTDATTALLGEQASEKVVDLGKVIEKQTEFRQEEMRRGDVVESVSREADDRVADTAASSASSDLVAERLQRELDAAERKFIGSLATCDARIAEQGKAAAEEYRLLANLYRESDAAAGIRAKEAEDYRIAGEACEAIYDGVRNSPR